MKKIFGRRNHDDIDGGTHIKRNENLPKTIQSTEITNFEVEFSLTCFIDSNDPDKDWNGHFLLSCKLQDGKVCCRYCHTKRYEGNLDFTFEAQPDFLTELEKIVREEDIAKFNGYSSITSGLPDMFGSSVSVDYASGEYIYTCDNQDIHLPLTFLRKCKALFSDAMAKDNAKKESAKNKEDDEPEDFNAGWVCECGTVNRPSSDYCYNCGMPKLGVDSNAECICGLQFLGKNVPEVCPLCGEKIDK